MTRMLQRVVGSQRAAAMTLFGESLDAAAAVAAGLALRTVDGEHDQLLDAALRLAEPATHAPRRALLDTKKSMRHTQELDQHADAVTAELAPQLASLRSPEFATRLEQLRSRVARAR